MFKIMIVEDDLNIREMIGRQLSLWNYQAITTDDFSNITNFFIDNKPDLVLLDVVLPLYDGYHWCKEIRNISRVPIIFISSASDNMNVIMAMNLGGDDFVVKPFEMNVLIAKVQALLRRTYDYRLKTEVIEHKGMIINMSEDTVIYNGKSINLSKNEYRILLTLIQNKGVIVSREKLMNVLWKTDVYIDENTLTVNVNRLRNRLEDAGIGDFIETKYGLGYIVK